MNLISAVFIWWYHFVQPMVKLRLKVGPKGQIVIPKILREKYGIKENGYVLVDVRDDELAITRAPSVDETLEWIRLRRARLRARQATLGSSPRWTWRRSSMRVFADASLFVYLNVPMPDEQARLVDSL